MTIVEEFPDQFIAMIDHFDLSDNCIDTVSAQYCTQFGEIDGKKAVELLNNQSVSHALT